MHPLFHLGLTGLITIEVSNPNAVGVELIDVDGPFGLTLSNTTPVVIRAYNNQDVQFTVYIPSSSWGANGNIQYERDSGGGFSGEATHGIVLGNPATDSYTFPDVKKGQKFRATIVYT